MLSLEIWKESEAISDKSEILVHGLIHLHLDFHNEFFTDIPAYHIERLQRVENQTAWIVTNAPYDQWSCEILKSRHWLPVGLSVMLLRIVVSTAPSYLTELLNRVQGTYTLNSFDEINFYVNRARTR